MNQLNALSNRVEYYATTQASAVIIVISTHIAYFGGPPIVLVVRPSLGVHSFKKFLALAKDGRRLGYVSPGVGTLGNLVAEYLAWKENIKLDHIPDKGPTRRSWVWSADK